MEIFVENISKTICTQNVLDNISFNVKKGEILGVWGPNGAGKTSLLKTLACYLRPDHGNVYYDKCSILGNPEEIKSKIGYLSEKNPLYEDMNVVDFFYFIAKIYHIPSFYAKIRIADILQICGLEEEKHKEIGLLSKGYKQRIGIAQALIHDPEVLILDEPTSGLDPSQILYIRSMIQEMNKDRSKIIIVSSHVLQEIETLCDRVIMINRGKLIADGITSELQNVQDYLYLVSIANGPMAEIKEKIKEIEGVISVSERENGDFEVHTSKDIQIEKGIFDMCVSQNWYIRTLLRKKAHLNEIFQQIMSNENKE